jgi:hypothetical protein
LITSATQKNKGNSSAFSRLSIQQRLPLLICILLLTVIVTFSWVSYLGVRNASIAIGSERITTLVDRLSLIFKQSIDLYADSVKAITAEKSAKEFLSSPDEKSRRETLNILKNFHKKDTLRKLVQLLDAQKKSVLNFGDSRVNPAGARRCGVYQRGQVYFVQGIHVLSGDIFNHKRQQNNRLCFGLE